MLDLGLSVCFKVQISAFTISRYINFGIKLSVYIDFGPLQFAVSCVRISRTRLVAGLSMPATVSVFSGYNFTED